LVTHAFHPLKGRMYTVTAVISEGSDDERVMFRDELDYLRHMPARWTDFAEPDPSGLSGTTSSSRSALDG